MHRKSFDTLRAGYQDGSVSPLEVAESALQHAVETNYKLNAFALIDHQRALTLAKASELRWKQGKPLSPLDGMPITVKEFAAVQGWPTRRGSTTTSADPVQQSAPFVQRLLDAGAVILGKTRAPEFNWKGVTDSPGYGVTRNPLNPDLTPGGSSGGCSAAVAAGVVRVSLGSDAGGSVRIPAAFTGTVALKPTFGRIPQVPLPSAFCNVTHTGPIAASVSELAEVMDVVSGPASGDWSSVGLRDITFRAAPRAEGLRVGLLADTRWDEAVPTVKDGMRETIDLLTQGGFDIHQVDFDVRRASRVGTFFYKLGCRAVVHSLREAQREQLDPGLLRFIESVQDVTYDEMLKMQIERDASASEVHGLFDSVDVLVLPTMPILPFEAGRDTPSGWFVDDWMSWNPYTPAFNTAQTPALSYPIWPQGASLPMSVQIVAAKGHDELTLALATWLEERRPVQLVR